MYKAKPTYRRNYKKTKKEPLSQAAKKQVAKIAKKVTEKETEAKQNSGAIAATIVYNGAGYLLDDLTDTISQSLTDSGRIADQIVLKSIELDIFFNNTVGAGTNAFVNWRVIVFQFKSKSVPVPTDMLITTVANDGTNIGSFSSYNIDFKDVYHVLYDKTFMTAGTNTVAYAGPVINQFHKLKFKVPMKYAQKKIQYEGGTNTALNGIWLFVTQDHQSAGVGLNPTVKFHYKVTYLDF